MELSSFAFKSLELVGFKSFADRTVIDFRRRMTAIIRTQRIRKIEYFRRRAFCPGRGLGKKHTRRQDGRALFRAGLTRRAMNFAEGDAWLDNTGEHRIDLDYDEITVTRRYTKASDSGAGGSEYLLNRQSPEA